MFWIISIEHPVKRLFKSLLIRTLDSALMVNFQQMVQKPVSLSFSRDCNANVLLELPSNTFFDWEHFGDNFHHQFMFALSNFFSFNFRFFKHRFACADCFFFLFCCLQIVTFKFRLDVGSRPVQLGKQQQEQKEKKRSIKWNTHILLHSIDSRNFHIKRTNKKSITNNLRNEMWREKTSKKKNENRMADTTRSINGLMQSI